MIGDAKPGVDGSILSDVADPGKLVGSLAGGRPSTLILPAVGASIPVAMFSSVVLPRRWDQPGRRRVRRGCLGCSPTAPASPVLLAEPAGFDGCGHIASSCVADLTVCGKSLSMLSQVQACGTCLAVPPHRSWLRLLVGRYGPVAQRLGHEGADPRPGRGQALVLEFAVGLEHCVGVDRQRSRDVLDRREADRPPGAGRAAAPAVPAG